MSYCCPAMQDMLELTCTDHPEDACPDQIIVCADDGGLAIPIHDGGDSAIGIDFCPWCGTPATVEAWEAVTAGLAPDARTPAVPAPSPDHQGGPHSRRADN